MAKVKNSYKKPQPTKQLFYTGDKSQPVSWIKKKTQDLDDRIHYEWSGPDKVVDAIYWKIQNYNYDW